MSDWTLGKNGFTKRRGPLLTVVLDGVGIGRQDEGDAVKHAHTPVLDALWRDYPTTQLRAHGTAVGLPSDDDMGNSEVGHNAIGAGQVYAQGAKRVEAALSDGSLFAGKVWNELVEQCKAKSTPMHFIGLLSDGNVHSHIEHLFAMVRRCHEQGVEQVCVHPLLDGRDVPAQSSLEYLDALERLLSEINGSGSVRDYRVASGGGRMLVSMDRYEADWRIVERGWKAHVLGQGRRFASARQAVEAYRAENADIGDQFLGEFVIERGGQPAGLIEDDHCVVLFNFRGDRAIEITRAFEDPALDAFDRGRVPRVRYAGMMQYDGDLMIPKTYLVDPPSISQTMGEYLVHNGVRQFACSETQKYGHVTYFWNGNRGGKFDDGLEDYLEITSDLVPFEQRPWMKAAEITDATIEALDSGRYGCMRINYANGDMVGHTGDLRAAMVALESVDLCLGRLLGAVERAGGVALVTADHGNSDQMYELAKSGDLKRDAEGRPAVRTAHSLNPVPFSIYDPGFGGEYEMDPTLEGAGLSNIAATALWLLGYQPPSQYDSALIRPVG